MKVLYLHQYFNTPEMSGGTRSYEMARRLQAKGHEVHVITSWREPTDQQDWFRTEESGVNVHWLPVNYANEMAFPERIKAFFSFAAAAATKAASIRADVVFATSTPLTIAIPGAFAAWRQRIPMVFEVRDLWPEMPIAVGALRKPLPIFAARRLERFAYNRSAHVVALSPGMREGVISAGYPADQVSMIPNSADLESFGNALPDPFFSAHPELSGRPVILYAGTLGMINNVAYLADVAAAAARLDSRLAFVVIGSGATRDEVQARAAQLDLIGRNFFMYHRIPKREVASAFAAATVVLSLFADTEAMRKNSANKFFDGLAAGRPLAVNYGGWHAELLEEAEAGLVLPPDAPEAAAAKLVERAHDPHWLERTGRNARRLAEERFARDNLASELEAILLDVVRKAGHRKHEDRKGT